MSIYAKDLFEFICAPSLFTYNKIFNGHFLHKYTRTFLINKK